MSDFKDGEDTEEKRSQREVLLESRGDKKWAALQSRPTEVLLNNDGTVTALGSSISSILVSF